MVPRKVSKAGDSGAMTAVHTSTPEKPSAVAGMGIRGAAVPTVPPLAPLAPPSKCSRRAAGQRDRKVEDAACLMSERVRDDVSAQVPVSNKADSNSSNEGIKEACTVPQDAAKEVVDKEGKSKGHVLGPKAARRVREVLASWHHDLYMEGPLVCDLAFHMFQRALRPLRSKQVSLDGLRTMLAACLWVAAKLDEKQKNMPRASEVAEVARLDVKKVTAEEFHVMALLNWKPLEGFEGFESEHKLLGC